MAKNIQENAGSAEKREPAFVLIARLQKAHGVRGEIAARLMGDHQRSLRTGRTVYIGADHLAYKILSSRPKQELLLLAFEGINQREEAALLTNSDVYARLNELPGLPKGEYYDHQLIGLQVFENERLLGELEEVLKTGANDVYVVHKPDGRELLLPAIPPVILKVDLDAGTMQVALMEGLDE